MQFRKDPTILVANLLFAVLLFSRQPTEGRFRRQTVPDGSKPNVTGFDIDPVTNNVDPDLIWGTTTVAVGDTAVLHCSFDAIFSQLRNGNIDWVREAYQKGGNRFDQAEYVAIGKRVVVGEKRYRVFRPHNSALSVLIIRRCKRRDAGVYRCNLSGSSTRHKYMILNVTESKIEAQTSPAKLKARVGKDITMWCNATGYPKPIVYWAREDRNKMLQDGSQQYWGNGLTIKEPSEEDTGVYTCYLDNFVQPVVSYKFTVIVEDRPWNIHAQKMRYDSLKWFDYRSETPAPLIGKSFLIMCETKGAPKPVPNMRWFHRGRELANSKDYYIFEETPSWKPSYTSSTLVLLKFDPSMEGDYTCVASNVFRMKKKTITIYAPGSSLADKAPAVPPDVDNNGLYYWADDEDEVEYDYDYSYEENQEA